jgi:hypothetical protein
MEPAEYKPFAPQVHEYVDGRLSADDERAFERRLERDPELKSQVESLKRSLDALAKLPVLEPKEGFDDRVIGRVREEELATRARKQIIAAPVPLWQHVVQVGLGAAAAALVLAVIGVPGMFGADPDDLESTGGGPVARVTPTEEDLLPVLADQSARFDSLRRNVAHTRLTDGHLQLELVSRELEYSDLMRRNRWLAEQVAELPGSRRAQYQEFLAELDAALSAVAGELNDSQREARELNTALVNSHLAKVRIPEGVISTYTLHTDTGMILPPGEDERMATGQVSEMVLYSLIRQADYRHDHSAVIDAADLYLRHFDRGLFKDHANAAAIGANLRLGDDKAAAERFTARFGEYDEDLQPGQLDLVRGLLTVAEFERLTAARKALRD